MRTLLFYSFLLLSSAGFSQIEFNSPITLSNNAYQYEFIDRVISVSENHIKISTIIDSVTTDIQLLKIKKREVVLINNGKDHIFYCTSTDNKFPTKLIFRQSENIISNIIVIQPSLVGMGVEEFNFLIN